MATIDLLDGPIPRWRLIDGDVSAEVAPARGALVTSFVVGGVPVLYLEEATFLDVTKNVRGGVPLLFPFAGKPPPGSSLPQHGFARTSAWEAVAAVADEATARLECRLQSTPQTRSAWPFDFDARFAVSLFDGRLMLEWAFTNTGAAPMPLHFGIHPYFCVGPKERVSVSGATGRAYDNRLGAERDVTGIDFAAGEVDLHFATGDRGGAALDRGDRRTVQLSWTEHFDTLVLWTLPDKPFVCVEPWTARGQQPARLHVAPGATERLAVACWLEP